MPPKKKVKVEEKDKEDADESKGEGAGEGGSGPADSIGQPNLSSQQQVVGGPEVPKLELGEGVDVFAYAPGKEMEALTVGKLIRVEVCAAIRSAQASMALFLILLPCRAHRRGGGPPPR